MKKLYVVIAVILITTALVATLSLQANNNTLNSAANSVVIPENGKFDNHVRVYINDYSGNLDPETKTGDNHNLVTNAGLNMNEDMLKNVAKYIALSAEGTAPSTADTSLAGEKVGECNLSRQAGVVTDQGTGAYGVIAIYWINDSCNNVWKTGLFNASTGGTLFAAANWSVTNSSTGSLNVQGNNPSDSNSDKVTVVWNITLTQS